MLKFLIKRLISLIPVIFVISVILFGMLHAMPGDPVDNVMPVSRDQVKNPRDYERIRDRVKAEYGFDKPLPEQYVRWIGKTLQGDLGYSASHSKPVKDAVAEPLKNSIILNIGSTVIAFAISIIVGIKSAVRRGKFYDRLWQVLSMIGYSLPSFFIAMILIFIFAQKLKWFPSGGIPSSLIKQDRGNLAYILEFAKHLVLPTVTLTIGSFASTSRYVRNAMIEALSQDYIRTARSKGLSESKVIYTHAFKNALIPVVTVVAWGIAGMFGGAAITEQMFAYNGIGRYLIQGVLNKDFSLVLAMNMFYTIIGLAANVLMDIGYALVDPRIRLE